MTLSNSVVTEVPALGTLPHLAPYLSSSGCSLVLFIIKYTKAQHFPEFCESIEEIYKLGEEPLTKLDRRAGNMGTGT